MESAAIVVMQHSLHLQRRGYVLGYHFCQWWAMFFAPFLPKTPKYKAVLKNVAEWALFFTSGTCLQKCTS